MPTETKPARGERERQTGPAVRQALQTQGKRCFGCGRPMDKGETVLRVPLSVRNGKYWHDENRAFGTCCAQPEEEPSMVIELTAEQLVEALRKNPGLRYRRAEENPAYRGPEEGRTIVSASYASRPAGQVLVDYQDGTTYGMSHNFVLHVEEVPANE